MAGAHSRGSEEALLTLLRANASLAWLLAAPQTRRVRCSREAVPPGLLEDLADETQAADGEGEDVEPQLDLLCALLVRHSKKGTKMPQAAACARPGDSA
eukprot:4114537-Prymnesium_polylepis.2